MAPRSLYDQARSQILRNIEMLTDIGDLPYSFMRPVLLRLESPTQLRELEKTCPQLLGEDGEVWLKFVKRDVSGWEKKVAKYTTHSADGETATIGPKDPKNWYKLYKTLKREADEENRLAEEMLYAKMEVIRKKTAENTVAAPVHMIPPKVAKRTANSTFSKRPDNSVLRFTGGSKTKDLMARVRRETKEHKIQHSGRLVTPTHLLSGNMSRVQKAPQGMIEQKKMEATTAARSTAPATGFKISRPATTFKPAISSELAAREARLKAAQSSGASGAPSSAHSSLAPGMTYRVPKLGARGSSPPGSRPSPSGSPAPGAKTGLPMAMKRKREVDVFMQKKKR